MADKKYAPRWLHVISNGHLEQPAERDWLLMPVMGTGLGAPTCAHPALTIPIFATHNYSIYEGWSSWLFIERLQTEGKKRILIW